MKTPDRSVEEIVEEIEDLVAPAIGYVFDDGEWMIPDLDFSLTRPVHTKDLDSILEKVTQTLQAERQKRYEALEEAGNYVDELYQSGNMGKNEYELLTDFFDEKLTQPNNPK